MPKFKQANCKQCNQSFKSMYKVERESYASFCSRRCVSIYSRGKNVGIHNPNYKPKEIVNCVVCDKTLYLQPCRVGNNNVCSKTCRTIHIHSRRVKRTNIEIEMAKILQELSIPYSEQYPMYNRWVVDFKVDDKPIIIFCDGLYWHSKPEVASKDKGQTNYLEKCGWHVLRFTDKDILSDRAFCVNKIKQVHKSIQRN